jgi:hypothetical protein
LFSEVKLDDEIIISIVANKVGQKNEMIASRAIYRREPLNLLLESPSLPFFSSKSILFLKLTIIYLEALKKSVIYVGLFDLT